MREIVIEIRDFIKKDFNLYAYLYTLLFLVGIVTLNFTFRFEQLYINRIYDKPLGYILYPFYYLLPYLFVLIPSLLFKGHIRKVANTEFWVKCIVFFGIFGFMNAWSAVSHFFDITQMKLADRAFIRNVSFNINRILPFIIVFLAVKLYYDKDIKHLYGLRFKGMNYRPFFLMLLLMVPLITLASFQPDFQRTYPQFKFWFYQGAFGMSQTQTMAAFEFFYGIDFISVELMYRGALVIGMARLLDKDAVIPMAAAYVVLHFGKPLGEAISSFFGGFILGVHSLAKKNIFGGIIIHVGIAYTMEAAAILQHYFGQ
jgi:hypothetical protein